MDKRTKILGSVFGLFVVYGLYASVIGPRVVQPLFSIKDEIADLSEEKSELEELEAETRQAVREFAEYCGRNGSFNILRIEQQLHRMLVAMMGEHKLEDTDISPTEPRIAKRTRIEKMKVTVKATGTLENAMKFLKDLAEVPQVTRMLSVKVTPVRSRGKRRTRSKEERVTVSVPIEIMMMPPQMVAMNVTKDTLDKKSEFVRHENRDYSNIWTKTPFTQYIVYPPLKLSVKESNATVVQGKSLTLEATATGGDGDYIFEWSGGPGIKKPKSKRTTIDTKSDGKRSYTVMVTDGQGLTERASVDVTIEKKPEKRVAKGKPKPKPKPKKEVYPRRDKEGNNKQIVMAMTRRNGADRDSEIMISNDRSKETEYYKIGDPFDGGQLVYIHASGAVARQTVSEKSDIDYYAYPMGQRMADGSPASQMEAYPKLKWAADWFKEQDALRRPAEEPASTNDGADPKAVESSKVGSNQGGNDKAGAAARTNPAGTTQGKSDAGKTANRKQVKEKPAGTKKAAKASDGADGKAVNRTGSDAAQEDVPAAGGQPKVGTAVRGSRNRAQERREGNKKAVKADNDDPAGDRNEKNNDAAKSKPVAEDDKGRQPASLEAKSGNTGAKKAGRTPKRSGSRRGTQRIKGRAPKPKQRSKRN
ncbi:MAG: hypothetical protein ACYTHJ_13790 [Planctomycetota bacterium]|jgi:hypothetical protein